MEDVQPGVPCRGMDGWMDGSMLAWLPEEGIHATQPGKGTEQRSDRCKNTATQRRGRAHPPFSSSRVSSVSMQHSCLKPNKITAIVGKRIPTI